MERNLLYGHHALCRSPCMYIKAWLPRVQRCQGSAPSRLPYYDLHTVFAADETAPPVAVMEQEEEEAEEEEVDGEEGVVEDTDAGGAEGDDSMMDDENINIKMEVPDDIAGSTERCYSSLLTLSSVLDAEVLLQAVGHKVSGKDMKCRYQT